MEDKLLMDLQNQLGRIEATTIAIKEDINDLKAKDVEADQKLEQAYNKAMDYARTRQDTIRDDLQHQIDNNKTLILTVNESINNLNKNIDKVFKDFSKDITEKVEDLDTSISKLDTRISTLETKKEKAVFKWYEKIADKVVWIFLLGALVVILKWLNAPPEVINQLPH